MTSDSCIGSSMPSSTACEAVRFSDSNLPALPLIAALVLEKSTAIYRFSPMERIVSECPAARSARTLLSVSGTIPSGRVSVNCTATISAVLFILTGRLMLLPFAIVTLGTVSVFCANRAEPQNSNKVRAVNNLFIITM